MRRVSVHGFKLEIPDFCGSEVFSIPSAVKKYHSWSFEDSFIWENCTSAFFVQAENIKETEKTENIKIKRFIKKIIGKKQMDLSFFLKEPF